MKRRLIEYVLVGIILVIAAGMAIHTPLTIWLGSMWPDGSLFFKAWKEVLMGVGLVLLIVAAAQRQMVREFLNDRLMQIALLYAGIHFAMMSMSQGDLKAIGAGMLIDLRYVLYFVLVYGTIRLFPVYRRAVLVAMAGGAAVVVVFAVLQLFVLPRDILVHIGYGDATIAPYMTVDENANYIRINSTLRGPNPLGAFMVMVLSLLLAYFIKFGRRLKTNQRVLVGVVAAMAGMVLWASYSRSSFIGLVVAVVIIFGATASTPKVRRRLALGILVSMVVIGAALTIGRNNSFVSNVILHDNPTTGAAVDSNAGHAESLITGVNRLILQPLGGGVGSTGSASLDGDQPLIIENQYLFVAHEVGWAGLVVFVWLFIDVMRRLWWRRKSALALGVFASGCGLAVIGLLLPVWVDDTVSIIWWGLAAVAVATTMKGASSGTRKSN